VGLGRVEFEVKMENFREELKFVIKVIIKFFDEK
jgi:hypothetical protein